MATRGKASAGSRPSARYRRDCGSSVEVHAWRGRWRGRGRRVSALCASGAPGGFSRLAVYACVVGCEPPASRGAFSARTPSRRACPRLLSPPGVPVAAEPVAAPSEKRPNQNPFAGRAASSPLAARRAERKSLQSRGRPDAGNRRRTSRPARTNRCSRRGSSRYSPRSTDACAVKSCSTSAARRARIARWFR